MMEITQAEMSQAQMWVTGLVGAAATIEDLARRTISNWICLAALASGIAVQAAAGGWRGLGTALLGAAAGFAVFLVFYVLGGMGGGDVKLMAGFGALVGVSQVHYLAFWTALTGGVLAAVVLGGSTLWSAVASRGSAAGGRRAVAIPYAPAIVLGVWLTLLAAK